MTTGERVEEAKQATLQEQAIGDLRGQFEVRSYQRGYRWGPKEVQQLLQDINDSRIRDASRTYYLQPIVVKQLDDHVWELVDGQQRLTTLFLLLGYLRKQPGNAPGFWLQYTTRPLSAPFLEHLRVSSDRRSSLGDFDASKNIDFFHMEAAHHSISRWFEDNPAVVRSVFLEYLTTRVKVLRYDAGDENPVDLFIRLNVGRIALTDAELVKALLLSRSGGDGHEVDRSQEIAAQWDSIERDLRDPELWAFATGKTEPEATHIGLLLEAVAGKRPGAKSQPFAVFATVQAAIEEKGWRSVWDRIVNLHSILVGWFEDTDDLYHRIVYLIATGVELLELLEDAENQPKKSFRNGVSIRIRDGLKLSRSMLGELGYDNRALCTKVLLLMNVETVRRVRDSSRYSFRQHALGAWSLEHIHAQHSLELQTEREWRRWLIDHGAAIRAMADVNESDRDALTEDIDTLLKNGPPEGGAGGEIGGARFRDFEDRVIKLITTAQGPLEDINSIDNLALLDGSDNSRLSNSIFEVKRRDVLKLDRKGAFIPICTRRVFLKYYTDIEVQHLHFWSPEDRVGYLRAMVHLLNPYMPNDSPAGAA